MSRLRDLLALPITVEQIELEGLRADVSPKFTRHTTLVHVGGAGERGSGEDVTYTTADQKRFQENARTISSNKSLHGKFTLASWSAALESLDLFGGAQPEDPASHQYRRWAFESAGLDLALRQANSTLADFLGLELQPLRFASSMGLGAPPDTGKVRAWRSLYPSLEFKLDADPGWTRKVVDELRAIGRIVVVDYKGFYRGTIVDTAAGAEWYARVAGGLPEALIEDAWVDDQTRGVLEPIKERLTFDAPIHSVADAQALPWEPRQLNVKPSRFGRLHTLIEFYEFCEQRGIGLYGGGQFELGCGRGQAQYLAALFHADAPNDLAPIEWNSGPPRPGLPESPLRLEPAPAGFQLSTASASTS